jgi:hypothetical protein
MSDTAIFLTMILVILTLSLLSLHCKLDELDDDIKKALGLESRREKDKFKHRV